MSDVNELANRYLEEYDNEDKPKNIARDAFIYAYQKAREDLLSQAMDGYEEWIHQQGGPTLTFGSCWHQARFSSLKEIETLKTEVEKLKFIIETVNKLADSGVFSKIELGGGLKDEQI